jgi:hypothetical protein
MGLRGNLTCGEILEQLVHANARMRVRNIVFMGMGEPLNNYEQVGAVAGMAACCCSAHDGWRCSGEQPSGRGLSIHQLRSISISALLLL